MTYSVVELLDRVVIIPTKWMIRGENGEFYCFYPSKSDVRNINNIVKKLSDPGENWQTYKILNHLKTTDTLEKAKQKLLESLVLSEVDSDRTDNYAEKFKKSRHERARRSSPDNAENSGQINFRKYQEKKPKIIEDVRLGSDSKLILPPPCKRQRLDTMKVDKTDNISRILSETERETVENSTEKCKRTIDRDTDQSSSVNIIDELKKRDELKRKLQQDLNREVQNAPLEPTVHNSLPSTLNKPQLGDKTQASLSISKNPESLSEDPQKCAQEVNANNSTKLSDSKSANPDSIQLLQSKPLKEAHSAKGQKKPKEAKSSNKNSLASMSYQDKNSGLTYEELSLSKLNEIILLLRNIKLQSPVVNDTVCGTISFFDSDDCPNLPIKTKEELESLNNKLKRKSLKRRMIQALGSIGGRNLKNVVANICGKLFSNETAVLYSWSGRKKPKLSLEETNFAKLIINSVKANNSKYTEDEIKDAGSKWFAQAKTRLERKAVNPDEDEESDDEETVNNSNETEKDKDRDDADDEQD